MLRARRGNALHEALPEGACVGEIFVEVRIAAGAFRRLVEERDVVARVIGELVGVAGVNGTSTPAPAFAASSIL